MNELNREGIKVMIAGNNTPYDILNHEAVQATIDLCEAENDFKDLVQYLESGNKLPHAGITPNGTIGFVIP